jgi:hypothetical protein
MPDEKQGQDRDSQWRPPTEGEIRNRAYELYLERERECGGSLDDWLQAEAELLLKWTRD